MCVCWCVNLCVYVCACVVAPFHHCIPYASSRQTGRRGHSRDPTDILCFILKKPYATILCISCKRRHANIWLVGRASWQNDEHLCEYSMIFAAIQAVTFCAWCGRYLHERPSIRNINYSVRFVRYCCWLLLRIATLAECIAVGRLLSQLLSLSMSSSSLPLVEVFFYSIFILFSSSRCVFFFLRFFVVLQVMP